MQAYLLSEKKSKELPDKASPAADEKAALSDYLFKTSLFSVISALPLCCRDMLMANDGVLFQLALLALIQSEKGQKKFHIAKHKGKKNKLIVQAIIKKIKKEMGVIRKKVKRIKTKIKEEKKTKHQGLKGRKHKLASKKKLKVVKKSSVKKKAKRKPIKLLRKIKIKVVKKKRSKTKIKMSAKRLAKLSKPKTKTIQKSKIVARKAKGALKKSKIKFSLKKAKLSFLVKPDGKMMGKVAKKEYAKKRRAQFIKLGLLDKKRERVKELLAHEKSKKTNVANASSFFKKRNQNKNVNKASTVKNKVQPGFKNLVKTKQSAPKDMKNSA